MVQQVVADQRRGAVSVARGAPTLGGALRRSRSHPSTPATTITSGNGAESTVRATKDATASPTSEGLMSARRPTRATAWTTMAITAGATPANTAVTKPVSPNAT